MRPPLAPPRSRAELEAEYCHVVVRDYPETLAVFRGAGVDLAEGGAVVVREAVEGDPLLDAIEERIAWRRS